jgi:putative colanic acid biosynthesis UDP-glucose lipid carrier transferase
MKKSGHLREPSSIFSVILHIIDWVVLCLAGLGLWAVMDLIDADFAHYLTAVIAALMLSMIIFPRLGLYQPWVGQSRPDEARQIVLGWALVFLFLTAFSFISKTSEEFSRAWFVLWLAVGSTLHIISRIALRGVLGYLRSLGYNQRAIVVVGAGNVGRKALSNLTHSVDTGYVIRAFFSDDPDLQALAKENGSRHVGSVDELTRFLESNHIDQLWLAMPISEAPHMEVLLSDLKDTTIDIRLVPDIFGFRLLNHSTCNIAGLPVVNLSITPMDGVNRYIKDVEDKIISAAILLMILPLLLLLAVGVKLSSPGPVFYRQERVSWNGRVFRMLKFRTMPVDVERDSGAVWANRSDQRATRFGKLLRRTSLDELPQFWNVLMGDMSIVGPRPERPVFVQRFKGEIPGYMQKHMVKAGITGWAQVNGWRGDTDIKSRIEHDLFYIENWSLWFDIKIIILTLFKGFVHKNAY